MNTFTPTLKDSISRVQWQGMYQGALIVLGLNPSVSLLQELVNLTSNNAEALAALLLARECPTPNVAEAMIAFLRERRATVG